MTACFLYVSRVLLQLQFKELSHCSLKSGQMECEGIKDTPLPHRHKPHSEKSKNNIFKGITNGYSNADGIMHNSRAETQIAQAVQQRQSKGMIHGISYGKTIPNSCLPFISKNFSTDHVISRHDDKGESATKADLIDGYGSMQRAYAELRKEAA